MNQPPDILPTGTIALLIRSIRGQRVILDADLAGLYGVPTFRFNEAVKRNLARFPEDFMFRLTKTEWEELQPLRSQNAILKPGRGRHRKYRAFSTANLAPRRTNSRLPFAPSKRPKGQ